MPRPWRTRADPTSRTRLCTRPQLVSETTTSTQISSTKPLCSPAGWHGIIRSSTGTSEQHGRRSSCSWTSTARHGTPIHPTSMSRAGDACGRGPHRRRSMVRLVATRPHPPRRSHLSFTGRTERPGPDIAAAGDRRVFGDARVRDSGTPERPEQRPVPAIGDRQAEVERVSDSKQQQKR